MVHSRHQNQWRLKSSEPMQTQDIRTNGGSWSLIKLIIPTHIPIIAQHMFGWLLMGHTNNPEVPWHSGSGDGMEKKEMDIPRGKVTFNWSLCLLFSQTCTINTVPDFLLTWGYLSGHKFFRYPPKWTNILPFPFWRLYFDTVTIMRTDRDEKC